MIELQKADSLVGKILGAQRLRTGAEYKWSVFVSRYVSGEKEYLINTLTNQVVLLTESKFERGRVYSAAEVGAEPELTALVSGFFLVRTDADETARYETVISIMLGESRARVKKGCSDYTILPTTACNARCFYCFENGIKTVTMTPEVVEATVEFIDKTRQDGKINLCWFGGEPLLRPDIISKICSSLKQRGVSFSSKITTNGLLITEELAQVMLGDWRLDYIQFSLDGEKSEYERRKAFVSPAASPYERVMENIALLRKKGIERVNLRCNVDAQNLSTIDAFIEDLTARFPDREKISVEFVSLYDNHSTDAELAVYKRCMELNAEVRERGFAGLSKTGSSAIRLFYCAAHIPEKNLVISADGRLYSCGHCAEGTSFGNVFEGITDREVFESYRAHPHTPEKCRGCVYLPQCTTFSKCEVKNSSKKCREIRESYMTRYLEALIKDFNNNPEETEVEK